MTEEEQVMLRLKFPSLFEDMHRHIEYGSHQQMPEETSFRFTDILSSDMDENPCSLMGEIAYQLGGKNCPKEWMLQIFRWFKELENKHLQEHKDDVDKLLGRVGKIRLREFA